MPSEAVVRNIDEINKLVELLDVVLRDGLQISDVPALVVISSEFVEKYKLPGATKKGIVMAAVRCAINRHADLNQLDTDMIMALVDSLIDISIDVSQGKYKLQTLQGCYGCMRQFASNLLTRRRAPQTKRGVVII